MTTADGLASGPGANGESDSLSHTLDLSGLDVRGRKNWTITDVSGRNSREGRSKQIALLTHEDGDTVQVFVGTEEDSNVAEWYSIEWYRDDESHELTKDHDTSESALTQVQGIMLAVAERRRGREAGEKAAYNRLKDKLAGVMLQETDGDDDGLF